ncbi:hypothetical protein ALISP_3268 [Alicycliphilus sp. B1]|nr:hypothetical protein ALISP_3268 [Alicycliphilus sp. B1]
MPEVVLQHALLHGHLRAGIQVLHLAAAAGARVQAEMRTAGPHAQAGFAVDLGEAGLLPVVLLAMGVGADQFGGQGAVDEHDLAVALARHALGVHVHGRDFEPAGRQRVLGFGW